MDIPSNLVETQPAQVDPASPPHDQLPAEPPWTVLRLVQEHGAHVDDAHLGHGRTGHAILLQEVPAGREGRSNIDPPNGATEEEGRRPKTGFNMSLKQAVFLVG